MLLVRTDTEPRAWTDSYTWPCTHGGCSRKKMRSAHGCLVEHEGRLTARAPGEPMPIHIVSRGPSGADPVHTRVEAHSILRGLRIAHVHAAQPYRVVHDRHVLAREEMPTYRVVVVRLVVGRGRDRRRRRRRARVHGRARCRRLLRELGERADAAGRLAREDAAELPARK
jgi:hypothetical protein